MKILVITCADCAKLRKLVKLQQDMQLKGVIPQPQNVPYQLFEYNTCVLLCAEDAHLSLDDTRKLLDKLACVPNPPAVFLCTDYGELATHRAITWRFPRNTDEAFILEHMRTLTYPCGTPAEQLQVEETLMDFGVLPGWMSFLYTRDTILLALHEPLGSGQTLDGIIREVAAFRGTHRYSVSQSIHTCAESIFTNPLGISRVMKYSPEICRNLQSAGRTLPTNLEFVLMLTNLLKVDSRNRKSV